MAFLCKTIEFLTTTAAATQAVTGVGFKPKAIVFLMFTKRTVLDASYDGSVGMGIGMGYSCDTGVQVKNAGWSGLGLSASSDVRQRRSATYCIWGRANPNSAEEMLASVTSMDTDGFTLTFVTRTAAYKIVALCFGGDDITNVDLFSITDPASSGNVSVSSLTFKPKFVIFGDAWTNTVAENDTRATSSSFRPQISMFTEFEQLSICQAITPGSTVNAHNTSMRSDRCLLYHQNTSTVEMSEATFVSMNANGFTINYTINTASQTIRYGLAMAGVFEAKVGVTTEPGVVSKTFVSMPGVPRAAITVSQCRVPATGIAGYTATPQETRGSYGIWAKDGGGYAQSYTDDYVAGARRFGKDSSVNNFELVDSTSNTTFSTLSQMNLDSSNSSELAFDWTAVSGIGVAVGYAVFTSPYVAPPTGRLVGMRNISVNAV